MNRVAFAAESPVLRLTISELNAIPSERPSLICEEVIGARWLEKCCGGIRVRVLTGIGHDGPLIDTYRPVIRVQAISRLVPRRAAA